MTRSRRRPLTSRPAADPALIHMAKGGTQFAGENQYALAYTFSKAQVDVDMTDAHKPVIGKAQMGPVAVMDSLCRDYALLPEQLTILSQPFGICRVVDRFPTCERCGGTLTTTCGRARSERPRSSVRAVPHSPMASPWELERPRASSGSTSSPGWSGRSATA